jgi:hypothetical protein
MPFMRKGVSSGFMRTLPLVCMNASGPAGVPGYAGQPTGTEPTWQSAKSTRMKADRAKLIRKRFI